MKHEDIINGLNYLGFNSGWVLTDQEISFWDNDLPKPSIKEIEIAAEKYVKEVNNAKQALLDKLGITVDEAKLLLS